MLIGACNPMAFPIHFFQVEPTLAIAGTNVPLDGLMIQTVIPRCILDLGLIFDRSSRFSQLHAAPQAG